MVLQTISPGCGVRASLMLFYIFVPVITLTILLAMFAVQESESAAQMTTTYLEDQLTEAEEKQAMLERENTEIQNKYQVTPSSVTIYNAARAPDIHPYNASQVPSNTLICNYL